ncbi:unnamed protein product [marine sediment metagenome]|uniref:Uncharacterized protein n=1 Tax=marine sediment metagenome TaxID=412755 RepID=X1HC42_9ZZZZ
MTNTRISKPTKIVTKFKLNQKRLAIKKLTLKTKVIIRTRGIKNG